MHFVKVSSFHALYACTIIYHVAIEVHFEFHLKAAGIYELSHKYRAPTRRFVNTCHVGPIAKPYVAMPSHRTYQSII